MLTQEEMLDGSWSASWFEPDSLYEHAQKAEAGEVADDNLSEIDKKFAEDMGARNEAWRKEMMKVDAQFFSRLSEGQSPQILWIGCSDSRVAAEILVNGKPGEIFVHRNVANMVVSTDANLRAVLHYALEYLQVQHVIVCGHYDCGGVKAALEKIDHGTPVEIWLSNIRDVYRLHQEEIEAIIDKEERHKRFVELNVIEQCLNLYKTGDVQRRRVHTASRPHEFPCALPRIHAMVFSPHDGVLRRLPIDFKYYMKRFKNVYKMYDTDVFASFRDAASWSDP